MILGSLTYAISWDATPGSMIDFSFKFTFQAIMEKLRAAIVVNSS